MWCQLNLYYENMITVSTEKPSATWRVCNVTADITDVVYAGDFHPQPPPPPPPFPPQIHYLENVECGNYGSKAYQLSDFLKLFVDI